MLLFLDFLVIWILRFSCAFLIAEARLVVNRFFSDGSPGLTHIHWSGVPCARRLEGQARNQSTPRA